MSKPAALQIVATIPLDNSIVGPPTNLAITPDARHRARRQFGERRRKGRQVRRCFRQPDVRHRSEGEPAQAHQHPHPRQAALRHGDLADGKLALVTNRDDGTISVLSIAGKEVKVTDTVSVGAAADQVSAVAITPDGKRALAAKPAANKIASLIDRRRQGHLRQARPADRHLSLQRCRSRPTASWR